MDTLAHGLIGAAVFGPTRDDKQMVMGGFMGMLPDVFIYTTAIVTMGLSKGLDFATNPSPIVPKVYVDLYYGSHSLFTVLIIAGVLFLIKRRWALFAFPYFLHILVDIPFHCGLFSTRIFYPFSDFHVCGINYSEHLWLWEVSYGILVGIYYLIYRKYYRPYLKVGNQKNAKIGL